MTSRNAVRAAGTSNWICATSRPMMDMQVLPAPPPRHERQSVVGASAGLQPDVTADGAGRQQCRCRPAQPERQAHLPTTDPVGLRGASVELALLDLIAPSNVGHRPDHIEPWQQKRRPKPYPRLKKHRLLARADVLLNGRPQRPKQVPFSQVLIDRDGDQLEATGAMLEDRARACAKAREPASC